MSLNILSSFWHTNHSHPVKNQGAVLSGENNSKKAIIVMAEIISPPLFLTVVIAITSAQYSVRATMKP
ncbi:hypothetical protein AAH678_28935 [Sodalis endosymbiont of Spalangia cameroni]|uniref:hypothetical protein n=1 Tax=Sodalis praecaptivus TaxID=1239307 RepID=UPI0031FA17F8